MCRIQENSVEIKKREKLCSNSRRFVLSEIETDMIMEAIVE